ncbi:hypothetical protein VD0002_g2631 [Verticillium dahliae]|uniref:Uncharacterized protein n=1 Tax=Verticillium dahliae TaxID=27337 RepID=A0AA44WGC2_VERDA|nr:hypothetical protein BJF96_g8060 [Verticillium dahliae]PNH47971.1 hypothetical protein VD0004_g477 [Verticillium dahliae]PNH55832.1 hypothetical protein VD0003_g1818 [Verticillium dahliae]PNH66843.1 hypothetical protein VD0002_g2631 [Verticillium dahliae]PNH77091.1 hypothetical protein VD0001_g497 [Verticillium dahliae]
MAATGGSPTSREDEAILSLLSGLAPGMSWVGRYPGSTQEASYFLTHSEQYELAYFALRDPRFVLNMEYLVF